MLSGIRRLPSPALMISVVALIAAAVAARSPSHRPPRKS